MTIEGVKIYGLCIERLNRQIDIANKKKGIAGDRVVLECYNTGDIDEIIDILELYDVEHKTAESIKVKLDELAYTASLLVRNTVEFDYDDDDNLCLYLRVR
jgi:hypothetical protein